MIFVTVGSSSVPFDRLVDAAGELGADEPVLVQRGCSTRRPHQAEWVDYLPMNELLAHVRNARIVVSHGGVGSTLAAVLEGRRPVIVPRLERLGEAVDDHQLVLARRLESLGLITLVEDVDYLARAVREAPGQNRTTSGSGELVADLKLFLDDAFRIPGSEPSLAAPASPIPRSGP